MVFEKVKNWYGKYERPISSLFLVLGFVVDAVTVQAVDLSWQIIWIIANLVIVGVCIILVHAVERQEGDEANSAKLHFWLVNILQFFFGATLSTLLVFYFRGSDISVSWPFILLLAAAFWANESLKRKYVRLSFQISLFFLTLFLFSIFAVPAILHKLGAVVFVYSGVISLVVIGLFLLVIRYVSRAEFDRSKNLLFVSIAGILVLVNVLYFTNLIPPLPLSMKDGGVYHSLKRSGGNYIVEGEKQGLDRFWTIYPDYHKAPGESLYVFSAVFSPAKFDTQIFHEWQYKDPNTKKWVTKELINLSIVGGRDRGFRTYSLKRNNILEGHWRVNVKTVRGQVISRIRFNVVNVNVKPELVEEVKK